MIEKPQYGLTWFRIRFGLLQLKAYTKGEHVLRFEATVHNTKELRCRRSLDNFPEIITRLAGMAERFATALDCADISFLPDGTPRSAAAAVPARRHPHRRHRPEQAPDPRRPSGRARPGRRTARLHRRRVHRQGPAVTSHAGYTDPPSRLRPAQAPRQRISPSSPADPPLPHPPRRRPHHRRPARPPRPVIAPILAGVRSPRRGRKPAHWTPSTATTRPSASACKTSSTTSASRASARRRIDNILSIGEMQAP